MKLNEVIILEGADCSGKDTFIELYCKRNNIDNYVIFKNGLYFSTEEALLSYKKQIELIKVIRKSYVVFVNRCYISDIIYGDVCRNGDRISDNKCEELANQFIQMKAKFVFMVRGRKEIIKCWSDNSEEGIEYISKKDVFIKILNYYKEFMMDEKYDKFTSKNIWVRNIYDLRFLK